MSSPRRHKNTLLPTSPHAQKMSAHFDRLPEDAHYIISKYLLRQVERTDSDDINSLMDSNKLATLLGYAKNSDAQCRAMMRAMSNKLSPKRWTEETVLEWILTCDSLIFELDLLNAPEIQFPGSFPNFSQLRRASVYARTDHLRAIFGSPKLSSLTVIVDTLEAWDDLILTIRSLPLKELGMKFGVVVDDLDGASSMTKRMTMIDACPFVESLSLRGTIDLSASVWDVISALPCLKKLGLQGQINDEHMQFLQSMSEVDVYEVAGSIEMIQPLGIRVTGLFHVFDVDAEEIERLASFTSLQRLSITPLRGAERAIVGIIEHVEELSLSWDFTKVWHTGEGEASHDFCVSSVYPKYHTPDPKVLSRIVRKTPRLKSLKIESAIVKSTTIEQLLIIVGENLEKFQIAIDWQKERTAPRIERILKAVARSCPRLRTLRFSEWKDKHYFPVLATDEDKESCLRSLRKATDVLPGFSSEGNIKRMIEDRFVNSHPRRILLWDNIVPNS